MPAHLPEEDPNTIRWDIIDCPSCPTSGHDRLRPLWIPRDEHPQRGTLADWLTPIASTAGDTPLATGVHLQTSLSSTSAAIAVTPLQPRLLDIPQELSDE